MVVAYLQKKADSMEEVNNLKVVEIGYNEL
jgi:hypothetical protein